MIYLLYQFPNMLSLSQIKHVYSKMLLGLSSKGYTHKKKWF